MKFYLSTSMFFVSILASVSAFAKPISQQGTATQDVRFDDAVRQAIHGHVVQRGLRSRAEAAQLARFKAANRLPDLLAVAPVTGESVKGIIEIPIILAHYKDTLKTPYFYANLQKELFDGPWPTGTMT